jgi:hypothetical protein
MDKILKSVSDAQENIKAIEKQMFTVELQPLIVADPIFQVIDTFGIFKSEGGFQLGVIGKRFAPTQPMQVFEAFCDAIRDYGLAPEKLKFIEINGGSKVRFSIPIQTVSFKNIRGVMDTTEVILNLQIGFDGKTKSSMFLTTLRLVCTNGAKKVFTEFETSFKNVKGNLGKIVGMTDDVIKCASQITALEQLYLAMNKAEVNDEVKELYLKRVFDFELSKYGDYSKQRQNNIDLIMKSVDLEIGRTGQTLFGLYNGVTHYTNHIMKTDNPDNVYSGTGLNWNTKAEKAVLEFV